jgi:elongation factor P--(R)-beta-lysine ligase
MQQDLPFWNSERHADRRPLLLARGRIKSAIRAWFEHQGFVEVDTACLQVSPGNEAHLHAFQTEYKTEAGARTPLYLHTSPEFAMKKLLAAGETKIFTFAPVFRNGERGPLHSPEFTMLEWYRAGEPYQALMADCTALLQLAADVTERGLWTWRGRDCDVRSAAQVTTLDQAFVRSAGIPLLAGVSGAQPALAALQVEAKRIGMHVAQDDTWSNVFSKILAERIEPHLGQARPEFLCEYPSVECALARPCEHDPRVAERFELYVCGVELANAFGELIDPLEQRKRLEAEMLEKQRVYGERYPIDEDFLSAMAQMPAASGCALGFDRLVMLATGATSVAQVIWTPIAQTTATGTAATDTA